MSDQTAPPLLMAWIVSLRERYDQGSWVCSDGVHAYGPDPQYARLLHGSSLRYRAELQRRLGPLVDNLAQMPLVVLSLPEGEYYEHISHYYPEGNHNRSAGVQIGGETPHIVVANVEIGGDERVLAHEMTHFLLRERRLPLWLNEGLAVFFEGELLGQMPRALSPHDQNAFAAFWHTGTRDLFDGQAFSRRHSRWAYELSHRMVLALLPQPGFLQFVQGADPRDGGASAGWELEIDLRELSRSLVPEITATQSAPAIPTGPAPSSEAFETEMERSKRNPRSLWRAVAALAVLGAGIAAVDAYQRRNPLVTVVSPDQADLVLFADGVEVAQIATHSDVLPPMAQVRLSRGTHDLVVRDADGQEVDRVRGAVGSTSPNYAWVIGTGNCGYLEHACYGGPCPNGGVRKLEGRWHAVGEVDTWLAPNPESIKTRGLGGERVTYAVLPCSSGP